MNRFIPNGAPKLMLAVCLACGAGVTPSFAHHPIQAKFESSMATSLTGVVTNVDWSNPHAHVFVNVEQNGVIENWAIELESPILLKASGWNSNTLRPGDRITVNGPRARNETRQVWGESVVLADTGREVFTLKDTAPTKPLAARPAPRSADGKVALGGTADSVDGYWAFPTSTALVENGVEVQMDRYGQLAEVGDASKVAPLQPWALGLYEHRQERQLQDDPMYLNCKPPGGPRQYQSDLGIKFIEDKAGERVFILMGGGNHNFRIIYLDGRDPAGQVGGDDDNPLYYGRSVGEWEGDTLVVTTNGFNEDFWFTNGGLPHTSMLSMEERFSRPDADTLRYEVTIDDPGAYTRSWEAGWELQWVGGEELPVHFCQDNRP